MIRNIRSGTIPYQIPDFQSDGNSNVCIFQPIRVKYPFEMFDLENLGQFIDTTFAVMPFDGEYQPP